MKSCPFVGGCSDHKGSLKVPNKIGNFKALALSALLAIERNWLKDKSPSAINSNAQKPKTVTPTRTFFRTQLLRT
jgi:hypothetical protein